LGPRSRKKVLSRKAKDAIADGKNLVFISAAVIWEIRIKQKLGKLELPHNFQQFPVRKLHKKHVKSAH